MAFNAPDPDTFSDFNLIGREIMRAIKAKYLRKKSVKEEMGAGGMGGGPSYSGEPVNHANAGGQQGGLGSNSPNRAMQGFDPLLSSRKWRRIKNRIKAKKAGEK